MTKKDKNCISCIKNGASNNSFYKIKKGLNEQVVRTISAQKQEPKWMLDYRLKALDFFNSKKLQKWGPDLSHLNFNDLCFYLKPTKEQLKWNEFPKEIKNSFDQLNLAENEDDYLAGFGAQYESEVVYHNLKKEWEDLGVIFLGTDQALKEHPDIFKKYFGIVVSYEDNKFSALNSAVWSGGSFIYVPKNINVTIPLQAYYKIESQNLGQFERTLIVADEGSSVSYIEGCSAQNYSSNSLHSAVVEIVALKNAKVKYYTIQNWSKNIYNLVTKRALAMEGAHVDWIDCNLGSFITMKYPSVILKEKNASTSILSLAVAGFDGQIQDSGAKAIHLAPHTSSKIISKSISNNGGRSSFRGKVKVVEGSKNSKAFMQCDSLLFDNISRADSYPFIDVNELNADVGHEARISKIADDQIFYLMSRGLSFEDSQALIINGFVDSFSKNLPVEYAVEINRLVNMEIKADNNEK